MEGCHSDLPPKEEEPAVQYCKISPKIVDLALWFRPMFPAELLFDYSIIIYQRKPLFRLVIVDPG